MTPDQIEAIYRTRLTERERQALRIACQGKKYADIGTELNLSLSTIKNRMVVVFTKFGLEFANDDERQRFLLLEAAPVIGRLAFDSPTQDSNQVVPDEEDEVADTPNSDVTNSTIPNPPLLDHKPVKPIEIPPESPNLSSSQSDQIAARRRLLAIIACGFLALGLAIGAVGTSFLRSTPASVPQIVKETTVVTQTVSAPQTVEVTVEVPVTVIQTSPPVTVISTVDRVVTQPVEVTRIVEQTVVVPVPVTVIVSATPNPTTPVPPTTATPQLPTATPGPTATELPTVTPTTQPNTPKDAILNVGETFYSRGAELTLVNSKIETNFLTINWKFVNNTRQQLALKFSNASFVITDNLGNTLPGGAFKNDSFPCDTFERLLAPYEEVKNTDCGNRPYRAGLDTSNCKITELTVAAINMSARIPEAKWRIPVNVC